MHNTLRAAFVGVFIVFACTLLAYGSGHPYNWTYSVVDDPRGTGTVLTGVNEVDGVTGYWTAADGTTTAVRTECSDGCAGWSQIGYPNETDTIATGLDPSKNSTGYYTNGGNTVGYVRHDGNEYTALPVGTALFSIAHPNCQDLKAWACHGQPHKIYPSTAVGYQTPSVHGSGNATQAITYLNGVITPIIVPNAISSVATGINGHLTVVGYETISTGHSVITQGWGLRYGKFVSFAFPGATSTTPYGLNWQDDVVGNYVDASGVTHGFIYWSFTSKNAQWTTFDYPGSTSTTIRSMNGHDEMVGSYVDGSGVTHGFFVSPNPPLKGNHGSHCKGTACG